MTSKPASKLLLLSAIFAYLLIGIEIIIMITPFALYFYSVYGPILRFLSSSPLTAWTTEFFLPHMVFPNDPLITAISYLQILLIVGLVLFFAAAIPLYYGRFTGKGVVQRAFYSWNRHPQYLFLAISGFGLLLYWPRFIILLMYITMLFVYYLLACNEEWRMKQEAPGRYEEYMAKTPMFLPGEPGGKLFRLLFGWIRPKGLGLFAAYLITLCLGTLLAMGLRTYTVHHLPLARADNMTLVSVFPRPASEMRDLYHLVLQDPRVRDQLRDKKGANLAYIMPGDFFLTALVTEEQRRFSEDMIQRFPEILEWHQHKFHGGLGRFFRIFYNYVHTWSVGETDYSVERLIFVEVTHNGRPVPPGKVFDLGDRRMPTLIVDVDAFTEKILAVVPTSAKNKWGTMPMPTF
ncbi:MAG: methyltransferase [Deltaproteobacteria bacterium]